MRTLDEANQQLTAQLAQAQQQLKLYQDRSELMQRQLADVTNQMQTRLAAGMAAATAVPRVATRDESTASTGSPSIDREFGTGRNRRSGARLSANVSRGLASEPLRDLGYEVDFSSDGLRLRIPSDQLFQPGTSQLTASGSTLLDRVAEVLRAHYADRRIAIEGYTDNSPMYGGIYATSHQLTSAQADQVLAHWTRSNRLSPSLLTTLAHGSNDPISDNQNPAGRAENRRIEIVVQSEVTP
jgi:flagellar motor protein MotB